MTNIRFGINPYMASDFRNLFNDITRNSSQPRINHSRIQSAVNIIENDKGTEVHIALPGIDKENVDIKLDRDILNISVITNEQETNNKKENIAVDQTNKTEITIEPTTKYRRKEFDFSNFKRSFHLPESIDFSRIDAQFKNGVLIIELPKKEEVVIEPKKITIK